MGVFLRTVCSPVSSLPVDGPRRAPCLKPRTREPPWTAQTEDRDRGLEPETPMLDYLRNDLPPRRPAQIIARSAPAGARSWRCAASSGVSASRWRCSSLAAYGMEWARFSAASIIAARVLMRRALVASVFYFLVQAAAAPRQRRAGGAVPRGARAVAAGDTRQRRRGEPRRRRDRCRPRAGATAGRAGDRGVLRPTNAARRVEEAPLRRWGATAGRRRGRRLLRSCCSVRRSCATPSRRSCSSQRSVEAAAPYRIEVTPGNATVPKGADQTITRAARGIRRRGRLADGRGARRRRRSRRCRSCAATDGRYEGDAVRRRGRRWNTSSRPTACARRSSR